MSRPITYRFAGFLLEPARAALTAPDGRAIKLRPKTYEVLRHFLDNPGRVVSREELLETVSPGVFVTDDSVTQCVAEIRRALGPEAFILRTLKRRGYVLEVELVCETTAAARALSAYGGRRCDKSARSPGQGGGAEGGRPRDLARHPRLPAALARGPGELRARCRPSQLRLVPISVIDR